MKRLLILLITMNALTACSSSMFAMSASDVRRETRFLTDKMAYELGLTTPQYNDVYEINYDFINSIGDLLNYVVRGEQWAQDDYYKALDVRNDDLRWVLSEPQYHRFLRADHFCRPVLASRGGWSFRVYVNYPDRAHFYFGSPYHYHTYCGGHYRRDFHTISYYRGRHNHIDHYARSFRIRDERRYPTYCRSDFGSITFRSNSSVRPSNITIRTNIHTDRHESDRYPSNGRVTVIRSTDRHDRDDYKRHEKEYKHREKEYKHLEKEYKHREKEYRKHDNDSRGYSDRSSTRTYYTNLNGDRGRGDDSGRYSGDRSSQRENTRRY